MGYKKLISPEFRVTVGDYEVTDGIEVECFSSKESHMDWCRVELSPQLQGVLKFKDMDEASVELGYEDDFDSLIDGYVRCGDTDYWKEIMIKDDMMKLDRVTIKASFVDCEPQDVIRYVLACAGIEDYVLSDEHYGKKDLFVIDRKSGINTIAEVNSSWGIKNPFFFQKKVFYWGTKEEQKEIYVLEEGETILSLNKYGDLWEAETIAIPWIHHSQEVEVQHSKYSGIVTVEKTIVRSDDTGAVHMYCFKTEPDAGGNELKFYCCENTVIDAGEPVGRVLVEAEATGTYYNIAPGRITISMIHLDGVDYVTNEDDWLFEEGAEEEDLEDLRDRCMSSWAELATRTIEEKLRNAAKAVPGVLDARIDAQHPRGQGTVDVIVTGAAGEASPELIRKVGEAIEPLKGNYEDYLVKSSEVVRQDFELVIYLAEDAATDGVDAQATKLIEDMMALTRGEMNTLYRDSIIQVLSTKIDNYRKTDILQPSDDMVLEQDKVIMAGDINVTVRNVVQSARGKE